MEWLPLEQALAIEILGPLKPNFMDTYPETILIMEPGTKKGDIFLVPDLLKILAKFSIVPSPPIPEPIETPILSKLTLFLSIPESSTHSLEAATPYCMNLSKRLISFFSRYFSASKDGRLAANFCQNLLHQSK